MNEKPDPILTGRLPPAGSDTSPAPRRSPGRPGWSWAFVAVGVVVLLAITAVVWAAATGQSWPGSPLREPVPTLEPIPTRATLPWRAVEPEAPARSWLDTPTPWRSDAPGAERPPAGLIATLERLLHGATEPLAGAGAVPLLPTATDGSAFLPTPTWTPSPALGQARPAAAARPTATNTPLPPPTDMPLPPPTDTTLPPPPADTPLPPPPADTPPPPPTEPPPPPPTATPLPEPTATEQAEVTICHKPGTPAEQTMEVGPNALPDHLGHGDLMGPCP